MKIPSAALLILAVLIAGVCVNALVTDSLTQILKNSAQAPENADAPVPLSDSLMSEWENYRLFFYVTVQQARLDQVEQAIALIRAGEARDDGSVIEIGKAKYATALEQIRNEASFDLCRIF